MWIEVCLFYFFFILTFIHFCILILYSYKDSIMVLCVQPRTLYSDSQGYIVDGYETGIYMVDSYD